MADHHSTLPRLFIDAPIRAGDAVQLTDDQSNYLRNVLRLSAGAGVLVFNGRDGEWRAELETVGKRGAALKPVESTRAQEDGPAIRCLFAPLKRARLDYMVQKATEMGAARLSPVLTRRTVAERVNLDRMRANAIEAAEQCGLMRVPVIDEPEKLDRVLANWPADCRIVFCDEAGPIADPVAAIRAALNHGAPRTPADPPQPVAVLVGPEGGFAPEERAALLARPFTLPIRLGPRIMRADTAAVAAMAIVNAAVGDWR
ncbi:MAG: 16S rRNA (uracil(1498)-N(3))-methyltransferase [Hyphomicrobium sp.]